MIVADGETIFVGGLIKQSVEESKSGVPVIGRIPGVGRLFSNRENTKTRTETIVLITPTILGAKSKLVEEDTIEVIEQMEQRRSADEGELNNEMERFFGAH